MRTLGLLVWWATASFALPLARDGQAQTVIVLPAAPSPVVRHAAEELARYLHEMSGATVPLVAEADDHRGPAVHVGPTRAVRADLPAAIRAHPDSVWIRVDAGRALVGGGSDAATLHAVYRLLEQLGCRWPAPGIDAVPRRRDLVLPPGEVAEVPAFELRTFAARSRALADWGAKVGLNGFYAPEDLARVGGHRLAPGTHTWFHYLPSDPYFREHPEWFPLIHGQRVEGGVHAGQLCVTAPGVADAFAKQVLAFIDANPDVRYVSISPNDGRRWCECDACLALDQRLCDGRTTRMGLESDQRFVGDRVFWFANEVARRVAVKYPDHRLVCLAYVNYAEPPDTVAIAPNVIPWLCHYAPADYSRAIDDPTSAPNAQFRELLGRWAAQRPDLLFYGYVSKSMWWRLPRPVTTTFAADVRLLHRLGIRRYYAQSTLSDWALEGPLAYVLAHLLWNPAADVEALCKEWRDAMFGPAGEALAPFYREVEAAVRATGQTYSDNPPRQVPGLYDPAHLDRAEAALAAAANQATAEPYAGRVQQVREVFGYGRAMIRCLEAAAQWQEHPRADLARAAVEHGEQAIALVKVREAVDFVAGLQRVADLGVVATGFGQPETRGGRRCWNTDETGRGDGQAGWASLLIEVADATRPVRLVVDVWGESELGHLAVNTSGDGRGTAQGGVWKSVEPRPPVSGQPGWETVVFEIPPAVMAPGQTLQRLGLGGGDSQIWLARVTVEPGP